MTPPVERTWSRTYPTRAALDADTPSDARPDDLNKLAPEALQQFEEARQFAFQVLDAGVLGDETTDVVVSISGHANPNHRPKNGQPNDHLSVSIQQKGS
jgi:hypothetical protein